MAGKITRKQFNELQKIHDYDDDQQFAEKLEAYTGIKQVPYTAYNYFDANGNYVGCSDEFDLYEMLDDAYIEIVDDSQPIKTCAICGAPHVDRCCPVCGSEDEEDDDEV